MSLFCIPRFLIPASSSCSDPIIPSSHDKKKDFLSKGTSVKEVVQDASITQSHPTVVTIEQNVACGCVLRNQKIKEFFLQ